MYFYSFQNKNEFRHSNTEFKKERKIKDSGSEWDTVHIFKNVHMIIKGDRRK